jgi:hypothetical protein
MTSGVQALWAMMMTKIRDNMIIPILERKHHGCCIRHSPSVRGHLRPIDYRSGALNVMWPRLLDDVGAAMGESSNTSNLRVFRVSSGSFKGETKWL